MRFIKVILFLSVVLLGCNRNSNDLINIRCFRYKEHQKDELIYKINMLDIDSVDIKNYKVKLNKTGFLKVFNYKGTAYEYLSVYIFNKKYFDVNFSNNANSNRFSEKENSPVIYVYKDFFHNNIIQFETCNMYIECEEESAKKLKRFAKDYQEISSKH